MNWQVKWACRFLDLVGKRVLPRPHQPVWETPFGDIGLRDLRRWFR